MSIIITQDNLADVVFKDIVFECKKTTTINTIKVTYTAKVTWNGELGATALLQASMHQSKNWYNNNRPIADVAVQSEAECKRRKELFNALDGGVQPIDAVAEGSKARERRYTPQEVVQNMKATKESDPEKYKYWLAKHEAFIAEMTAVTKALKDFTI